MSGIRPDAGAGIFETLLVLGGRPIALEAHLRRLASSTRALYGAHLHVAPGSVLDCSVRSAVTDLIGPHRLRILATEDAAGEMSVELETGSAASAFDGRPNSSIMLVPTVIEGGLGAHKWRDRSIIDRRRAELGLGDTSHLLITDADGTVLETESGSFVALVDGALVSPPPDGRLLAGVTVALVFAMAERLGVPAVFGAITLADAEGAGEVFCTSAVRGLTPAGLAGRSPGARTSGCDNAASGAHKGGGTIAERVGAALFESWRDP